MAQGNNAKREGARSHELYQLQTLNRIKDAITGGGMPPSPTGLATEATALDILNAIATNNQDFEVLLVRDTGNADQIVQQITDWTTGTPTISYKDVNGNPYVPVGPLEYLDSSAVLNLMLTELIAINENTEEDPTVLTSSSTTGAGTIPAGSKAATIYIDGAGGSINSVVRPDGWSQTFEFNNDTLPAINYNGNSTATMYVDILT